MDKVRMVLEKLLKAIRNKNKTFKILVGKGI